MDKAPDTLLRDHRLADELRDQQPLPTHVRAVISRVTATVDAGDDQQETIAYTRVRTREQAEQD